MPKVKILRSKNAIGLALALVLTVLVIIGALSINFRGGLASPLLRTRFQQKTTASFSEPKPRISDDHLNLTSNWKEYRDINDGFSVKYPDTWTLEYSDANEPHWVTLFSPDYLENEVYLTQGGKVTIYIDSRHYYPDELSDIGNSKDTQSGDPTIIGEERVFVDGVEGTTGKLTDLVGIRPGNLLIVTLIPVDDKMYKFICEYTPHSSENIPNTCNLMLQEMRFLSN